MSSLRHIGRSTHHRFVQEPDLSPSFEYSLKVSSTVCSSAVGACLLLLLSHLFDCLVSDNLDLSQNLVTANTKSRSLSPSPWILLLLLAASLTATALLVALSLLSRHPAHVISYYSMAILNNCPGLEVKVVSNDRPLNEFVDNESDGLCNTVTKYVEVEADGAFGIHLQFTDEYTCRFGIRVEVRLDGQKVGACLYRASQLKKTAGHTLAGKRSKIGGRWHVSDWLFSRIVLGE